MTKPTMEKQVADAISDRVESYKQGNRFVVYTFDGIMEGTDNPTEAGAMREAEALDSRLYKCDPGVIPIAEEIYSLLFGSNEPLNEPTIPDEAMRIIAELV